MQLRRVARICPADHDERRVAAILRPRTGQVQVLPADFPAGAERVSRRERRLHLEAPTLNANGTEPESPTPQFP